MRDGVRGDDLVSFVAALNSAVSEAIERDAGTELEDMFDQMMIVCLRHDEVVLGGALIHLRELFRTDAVRLAFDALLEARQLYFDEKGVRGLVPRDATARYNALAADAVLRSNRSCDSRECRGPL